MKRTTMINPITMKRDDCLTLNQKTENGRSCCGDGAVYGSCNGIRTI